jgi:hypothetical protein
MANYEVANYITDLLNKDNIQLLESYLTLHKPSKEACQLAMETAKDFPNEGSIIDQFFLKYFENTFANSPTVEELIAQQQILNETNKQLLEEIEQREKTINKLRAMKDAYIDVQYNFNNFLSKLRHKDKSESFYDLIQILNFEIYNNNISKLGKWFDLSKMVFKNPKTKMNVLEHLFFDGDIECRKNFVLANNFTDFKGLADHMIDKVAEYKDQTAMISNFKEFLILNGQQTFEREFEREFEIAVAKHFINKHAAKEKEVFELV